MPQIKRASGFVLVREESGSFLYLTLVNRSHGDVGTPKGHAKPGESELETALRETEEETGIVPVPSPWFRREIRYPVNGVGKAVAYFVARTDRHDVRLSREHVKANWLDLDATLAVLRHDGLRQVFVDAAIWLKDPGLRRGLAPDAARALLEEHVGADAPVVAHTAQVAGMARAMTGDPDVEAAAWLHDIGRARTHGIRHPLEGFRIAVEAGHGGYAAPCISHYTKGRPPEQLDVDDALVREMREACDLDSFGENEKAIALADFMAVGDRRGTLEERHADLVARYGPSVFFDESLAAARTLKQEAEERLGQPLYPLLGIRGTE